MPKKRKDVKPLFIWNPTLHYRTVQLICFISRILNSNPTFSPAQKGGGALFSWTSFNGECAVFLALPLSEEENETVHIEIVEDIEIPMQDVQRCAIVGFVAGDPQFEVVLRHAHAPLSLRVL
jgi:hypothetical protein